MMMTIKFREDIYTSFREKSKVLEKIFRWIFAFQNHALTNKTPRVLSPSVALRPSGRRHTKKIHCFKPKSYH